MNFDRNAKCPCGSGIKFKRCYGLSSSKCPIFLKENRTRIIEEHNKRDQFVFKFFREVLDDTNIILFKDDNKNDRIPLRIQMLISFSLIDVLGSYWYEYIGKTGKTSERAQKWYEEFCLNKANPNLLIPQNWSALSSNRILHFRNSLVHFLGLSEEIEDVNFGLVPNNLPNTEHIKLQNNLNKSSRHTFIIKPENFYNLIREGAILMLNGWEATIKNAKTDPAYEKKHIEGIERIYTKINKEGAIKIARKK